MKKESIEWKALMLRAKKMKQSGKTLTSGRSAKILTMADTSKLIESTRYI